MNPPADRPNVDRVEGLPPEQAIRQLALSMDDLVAELRATRLEVQEATLSAGRRWVGLLTAVLLLALGVISNLIARTF